MLNVILSVAFCTLCFTSELCGFVSITGRSYHLEMELTIKNQRKSKFSKIFDCTRKFYNRLKCNHGAWDESYVSFDKYVNLYKAHIIYPIFTITAPSPHTHTIAIWIMLCLNILMLKFNLSLNNFSVIGQRVYCTPWRSITGAFCHVSQHKRFMGSI